MDEFTCLAEIREHLSNSKRLYKLGIETLNNDHTISKIISELSKGIEKSIELTLIIKKEKSKDKKLLFFKKLSKDFLSEDDRKNLIDILVLKRKYESASLKFTRKENLVLCSNSDYIYISRKKIECSIKSLENLSISLLKSIDINTRETFENLL